MKNRNIIVLITAGIAAVSVFLPWIEISSSYSTSGFSYGGYSVAGQSGSFSSGGISGISVGGGIFGLLLAIGGGYMSYKNIKWAFIAGAINTLNGIAYMLGWFGANSSYSASTTFGSSKASVDPQIGLYLFVISSAVFAFLTFKDFKQNIS